MSRLPATWAHVAWPARMVPVVLHRLAVLRSVVRPNSDQPSDVAPFDLIPCLQSGSGERATNTPAHSLGTEPPSAAAIVRTARLRRHSLGRHQHEALCWAIPRGHGYHRRIVGKHQIRSYLQAVQRCSDRFATRHDRHPPVRTRPPRAGSRSCQWLPTWLPAPASYPLGLIPCLQVVSKGPGRAV